MTRKPKRSPSFFKVLIGDFDNKLRIPPAFVKYVLKGNVPTMFTLYSDSGNSWRVRVMVEQGSYFFNSGWSKFVKHHDLEIGDFLVFFLVDTSTFDVLIYNGTACAKNIILAAKKRKCLPPLANRQIEETPSQKCASVSKKPRAVYRARSVSQEVESITEVTRKHVSFVMVVKKYHKYFAVRLGGGWSQFLHENEIVVGDTLLFEHIPSKGNLVHVQIVNKDRYRNRGRRNKQADASVKNTSPAAKRPRVRPCKQIEEPPSTKHAPSSKRTKGESIGNDEIVSEFTPKKASFVMVLKEYQKYSAVVPTSFAKEMGLAEKPSTIIKNSKGRKWLLNTIVDAKSQVRLGAGWSQFVQENKLELGDTLLFQHIPNTGNVINLTIICKVGDGNNRKRNNSKRLIRSYSSMASSSHQQGNSHLKFISSSPYFFKIFLQDTIQNGKLGIPRKFMKNHGNSMSSPAMLSFPSGAVWKVELTKSDGKIWLENGWLEFSNHYSLDIGHLLVFRCVGNSNFHVIIFDKSASEMQYPYTRKQERNHKSPCPQSIRMMRSTDSAMKTECNLKSAQQFGHNGKGDKSKSHCRIQRLKAYAKVKALERASNTFKSENPFFLVAMYPSYVDCCHDKRCRLTIPTEFVREHLMKEHRSVTLCNSGGKTWIANYKQSQLGKNQYSYLQSGWGTFVRDNNIQVNDVCAFELINSTEISLKVVIYIGQHANCHQILASEMQYPYARDNHSQSDEILEQNIEESEDDGTTEILELKTQEKFVALGHTTNFKLAIPCNFVKENLMKKHWSVILCNSSGKTWIATFKQGKIGKKPTSYLIAACGTFARDNNIQVGDVCAFELINSIDIAFKAVTYQGQHANGNQSLAATNVFHLVKQKAPSCAS
ncbi:hypothetical protein Goari_019087 [Gossypium aridum]|uniref:TF-B3 domain-containing protein n=1 Tax=Gossypium aridum TaxID=34290 RepID=A0A7J8WRK6_GOSAI|nr:hypothetical protein [Gossypium aridum]